MEQARALRIGLGGCGPLLTLAGPLLAQDDTDVLLFEVLTLDGPEFSALLVDAPPQTDGNGSVTSTISGGGQPLRAGRYRVEISALGEIPGEREFTIR